MRISDWSSDVCSSDLPGGPCDDDAGFAAGWRPPTIRGCERGYGMWAGWLGRTGQLDPLTHPWDRVTRERVKAFITEYSVGRAELTVAGAVRGIAYVLRACAPPDGVTGLERKSVVEGRWVSARVDTGGRRIS